MSSLIVKYKKKYPDVVLPQKESSGAAGYDIRAYLKEPIEIISGGRAAISTGLMVEVPENFVLSVRPRSGWAINKGITLVNSPGTIDSDFRGEIHILMINHGASAVTVHNGDRIAQLLLEKSYNIEWMEDTLAESERGEQGFGSTGI